MDDGKTLTELNDSAKSWQGRGSNRHTLLTWTSPSPPFSHFHLFQVPPRLPTLILICSEASPQTLSACQFPHGTNSHFPEMSIMSSRPEFGDVSPPPNRHLSLTAPIAQ